MEVSKRLIRILFCRFFIALLYLSRVSSQENSTSIRLTEIIQTTSVAKITVSHSPSKPNATTTTTKTTTTKTTIRPSTTTTITSKPTTTSPTRASLLSSSISPRTNWTTETPDSKSSSTSTSTSTLTLTSVVSPVSTPESTSVTISSSVDSTTTTTTTRNIIIGVVVGVGGAILLVAVVTVVVCWCRKSKFKGIKTKSPSNANSSIRQRLDQPIKVSDFLGYVDRHQSHIASYKAEFDSLPGGKNVGKSVSRATQQQNAHLNRYINILPFDETLVPLYNSLPLQGYINASFVGGYKKEKAYIASQAPVADSIDDFWQMIWEHNASVVIMVTNLFECGRAKCDKYWPNVDDSVTYGSIKVEGVAERSYGDYILRTFQVEKQISSKEKLKSSKIVRKSTDSLGEKQELVERRTVLQFHFTTWPDQGVPNTCSSLLKFYRHALKKPPPGREDGPIVIHCSAGVGRTGTLMAVDICLERAKEEGTVDVPKCVDTMRRQRMFTVQTVEQYIFIHHVLLEALTLGKVEIPCSQFDPVYRQITEPGLIDGLSRIQREYKVLDVLKPRYDGSQSTVAQKNPEKNRHSKLLPADAFLPYIKTEDGQNDVYVNAVHVCGYKKKSYDDDDDDDEAESLEYNYVTTQSPMRETIEDFWAMIRETRSSTIVMLNELEGVEKYWPEDGRTVEYGAFVITTIGEILSDDIRMTDLQVTCRRNSEVVQVEPPTSSVHVSDSRRGTKHDSDTFNVRHFRLVTWPDPLPRETVLVSLYSEVLRCQERNPNRPVVVHCLYGVERSGLFCGVMNVLDAIRHDAEVDVFNAVKRIRRTRPEFIQDLKQYKYLYDVAMERNRSMEKVDKEKTMGK